MPWNKSIVGIGAAVIVAALSSAASAQGNGQPSLLHQVGDWGPLEWIGIGSILVTLGINIEQNRRTRVDVKRMVDKADAFEEWRLEDLPDQYVRRDFWKDKIEGIERGIHQLDRRAGALEKHLAFARHEDREERARDRGDKDR